MYMHAVQYMYVLYVKQDILSDFWRNTDTFCPPICSMLQNCGTTIKAYYDSNQRYRMYATLSSGERCLHDYTVVRNVHRKCIDAAGAMSSGNSSEKMILDHF